MNNDGWGFMGAGASDNRLAGEDLQHKRQTRTADEAPNPVRKVTYSEGAGGPIRQAIDAELNRHMEASKMRVKHLEDHYKR